MCDISRRERAASHLKLAFACWWDVVRFGTRLGASSQVAVAVGCCRHRDDGASEEARDDSFLSWRGRRTLDRARREPMELVQEEKLRQCLVAAILEFSTRRGPVRACSSCHSEIPVESTLRAP